MITKINSYKPYGSYNLNNINKQNSVCTKPTFCGSAASADSFVSEIAKKDIPIPIKEAVSKILTDMKSDGFTETEQAFLNQDPRVVLKNLYLKAIKVDENQINLSVVYSDGGTHGGFAIASGPGSDVENAAQKDGFMDLRKAKLRKASDGFMFSETKRLDD